MKVAQGSLHIWHCRHRAGVPAPIPIPSLNPLSIISQTDASIGCRLRHRLHRQHQWFFCRCCRCRAQSVPRLIPASLPELVGRNAPYVAANLCGAILREDVLSALAMTQTELAERLNVSRVTISELLHERRALSPEMAVRLGTLLDTSPESWLRMQESVDLWEVRQQRQKR